MGGGSRELLGAVWCVPFGKDVSSTEFKLLISAVDTFCITFTAAKFLDSFENDVGVWYLEAVWDTWLVLEQISSQHCV